MNTHKNLLCVILVTMMSWVLTACLRSELKNRCERTINLRTLSVQKTILGCFYIVFQSCKCIFWYCILAQRSASQRSYRYSICFSFSKKSLKNNHSFISSAIICYSTCQPLFGIPFLTQCLIVYITYIRYTCISRVIHKRVTNFRTSMQQTHPLIAL